MRHNFWVCLNEIEAMHETPRANVKVERGLTLTFTRDFPYIAGSIQFVCIKFTCICS